MNDKVFFFQISSVRDFAPRKMILSTFAEYKDNRKHMVYLLKK